MPNWCSNRLTVTGDSKDILRFTEKCALEPHPDGDQVFDFGKIIPVLVDDPKWRLDHWGTDRVGFYAELDDELADDDDDDESRLEYQFDTAWSPPLPVVLEASRQFPSLVFELRYEESGEEFHGIYCCKGGTVTKEQECDWV